MKVIPSFLPFLTMIAFHRVQKYSLIIGIVDRTMINTLSSYFHLERQSCAILSPHCRYNLGQVRLFRGDSSGMAKPSSATCLLYSDVAKGEPSTW